MWKSRVLWALWIAAAFLLYIFTENSGAVVILICSVVIPTVDILINCFWPGKLSLRLETDETAGKKEKIRGILHVRNNSVIPCVRISLCIFCKNILTMEEKRENLTFSLSPKGKTDIPFSFKSGLCGRIELSVESVTTGDIFGLSRKKTDVGAKSRIIVFPDTFSPVLSVGNRMHFHTEGTEYAPDRPGADPSEVFAIREYRTGDSPKSIHWKLSQKLEKMMVRDPGFPLETSYMLLLENVISEDTEIPAASVCDCLTEVFCSVAQAMAAESLCFCIGWTESRTGFLTQIRIQSQEDLIPVIPQILSAGFSKTNGSSMERYLESTDNQYAQVLYFSPCIPASIQELTQHAGSVSLFLCSGQEWPEALYGANVHVTAFSEENYREELGYIVV